MRPASKMYTPQSIYMPKALAVKEYAFSEDMNESFRQKMEDGVFIKDNILNDGGKSILFGVLDGHGGRYSVDYVLENFAKEFLNNYKSNSRNIEKLFEVVFKKIDDDLKINQMADSNGCTACIGFIRLEEGKRVLYTANIGDSRAVICEENLATRLSYDHKANDSLEAQRIKNAGGSIIFGRVHGVLAITRTFGDHDLKNQTKGLVCDPFISRTELRMIHKYIIMGSDGLWDTVQDKDTLELIKGKLNCQEMSKSLLTGALTKGSGDNISVLILKIN